MLSLEKQNLVVDYMNLAKKMAYNKKKMVSKHIDVDDLISAAYLGLSDAADRYDGVHAFAPYASIRIMGAIQDYLRGLGIGKKNCKVLGQFGEDNGIWLEDKQDSQEKFEELIEGLPELGKDVIRLYFVDGLKLKEIGEKIGVGEARVSQMLSQYKELIKEAA